MNTFINYIPIDMFFDIVLSKLFYPFDAQNPGIGR